MTKEYLEEITERMKSTQGIKDIEGAHAFADYLLCLALEELGYSELVEEWRKVEKWYA